MNLLNNTNDDLAFISEFFEWLLKNSSNNAVPELPLACVIGGSAALIVTILINFSCMRAQAKKMSAKGSTPRSQQRLSSTKAHDRATRTRKRNSSRKNWIKEKKREREALQKERLRQPYIAANRIQAAFRGHVVRRLTRLYPTWRNLRRQGEAYGREKNSLDLRVKGLESALAVKVAEVKKLATKFKKATSSIDYCVCPILQEVPRDPVFCIADGHTYEKTAIFEWIDSGKRTSPVTRAPLTRAMCVPRGRLADLIRRLQKQVGVTVSGIKGTGSRRRSLDSYNGRYVRDPTGRLLNGRPVYKRYGGDVFLYSTKPQYLHGGKKKQQYWVFTHKQDDLQIDRGYAGSDDGDRASPIDVKTWRVLRDDYIWVKCLGVDVAFTHDL